MELNERCLISNDPSDSRKLAAESPLTQALQLGPETMPVAQARIRCALPGSASARRRARTLEPQADSDVTRRTKCFREGGASCVLALARTGRGSSPDLGPSHCASLARSCLLIVFGSSCLLSKLCQLMC